MKIKFSDLALSTPDKPRHKWGEFNADDDKSDRVELVHEPSGEAVTLNARDFGQHTLTNGITDLVAKIVAPLVTKSVGARK